MALFGKRDVKVPLLTRVCQVEDDEILALMYQYEMNYAEVPTEWLLNNEATLNDLRVLIYQEGPPQLSPVHNKNGIDEERWVRTEGILHNRIDEFKTLRRLTTIVMESIADAPDGEILIDLEDKRLRPGLYSPDLIEELNAQMKYLTPVLAVKLPQDDHESLSRFWSEAHNGVTKKIPREYIVQRYALRDGFFTLHWIRSELAKLLTKDYEQKVKRCPVCAFPFLAMRRNQQMCSIRCQTRRTVRRAYEKKTERTREKSFS